MKPLKVYWSKGKVTVRRAGRVVASGPCRRKLEAIRKARSLYVRAALDAKVEGRRWKNPVITTRLQSGLEVLGQLYHGRVVAKTYSNRTQAQIAAQRQGAGWAVYHRPPSRPFYAARIESAAGNPAACLACARSGGRVRAKRLPGRRYTPLCFKGGKSYAGEAKRYKNAGAGLKAYRITFRKGKALLHWERFAASQKSARDSAVYALGREEVDTGKRHDLLSVRPIADPRRNPMHRCACGQPSYERLCPRCQAVVEGIARKATSRASLAIGQAARPKRLDEFAGLHAEQAWLARERAEIERRYARNPKRRNPYCATCDGPAVWYKPSGHAYPLEQAGYLGRVGHWARTGHYLTARVYGPEFSESDKPPSQGKWRYRGTPNWQLICLKHPFSHVADPRQRVEPTGYAGMIADRQARESRKVVRRKALPAPARPAAQFARWRYARKNPPMTPEYRAKAERVAATVQVRPHGLGGWIPVLPGYYFVLRSSRSRKRAERQATEIRNGILDGHIII